MPSSPIFRAFAPLRETLLCVALVASAAISSTAPAENWDRFRGPNGAGQSNDSTIPTTWEESNFLWKQSLPGIGHSSPVIWDSKLFLVSADTATGEQIVSAFDAGTGAPLWKKKLEASKYHINDLNSLASSTPAVDAERLYVLWLTGGQVTLAALTHAGEVLWRRDVGPFKEIHGYGNSPIVVDDLVIVANNSGAESSVTAFDGKTGEVRWRLPRESGITSFATPCLLDPNAPNKLLITSSTASGLTAIVAKSGKVAWESFKDEFDQRCVGSPIVANGMVFAGCGQGGNGKLLLAVRPGNPTSPTTEVYRLKQNTPQVPTSVVAGDLLFVWSDRGVVSCYDVPTGKQHWRERVGGDFHSSPIRIGDRIINCSRAGDAVVLAADKEFKVLARNSVNEPCIATPAVANHRLYVRTVSSLYCIGPPATN